MMRHVDHRANVLALDGEIWLVREGELVYSPSTIYCRFQTQVEVIDGIAWLLGAGRLFRWMEKSYVSVD